ncbi:LTA synthase family protein [Foetidibacter luteolus]|uniref:LTA synthase family protein n=1 Tax=Foetidibacter luteolus TaxID=2608880 RepID=UPI00129BB56D|nr:LTA synthase family protein [Foetidibacter luteolus]
MDNHPKKNFWQTTVLAVKDFTPRYLVLLLLFVLLRLVELVYDSINHGLNSDFVSVFLNGVLKDIGFVLSAGLPLVLIYLLLFLLSRRAANIFFIITAILLCVIQAALLLYFQNTLVPLGGDLWGYTMADIKQTVGAAGIGFLPVLILVLLIVAVVFLMVYVPGKLKLPAVAPAVVLVVFILCRLLNVAALTSSIQLKAEYANNLALNKSYFFYTESFRHFFPVEDAGPDIYADSYIGDYGNETGPAPVLKQFAYVNEGEYPFLHKEETQDVLSAFFSNASGRPNIVVLVVEGLGRAFSNEGAYLGSYTPFIDSLSQHSLYWENCLSGGGRTFAVLPTLLGSLPFAKNGFAALGNVMPQHNTLLSLLQFNGYSTSFYYGGDSRFDNMDLFLNKGNINSIYDVKTFPAGYSRLPSGAAGESWGYGDKELFRWYFNSTPQARQKPGVSVLLTLATHSPFLVNDQQKYLDQFEKRMDALAFSETEKSKARNFKMQYASVLFTDDAIRYFFEEYARRNDFANTIFVITGDHQMPELPMNNKVDRYHVPLMIYSPMLKRTAKFSSIVSHFDVAASLLAMLKSTSNIKTPSLVSWIGSGLDTARGFRNVHAYPMMQTKNDLLDFTMGNNMINGSTLYEMNNSLELSIQKDDAAYNRLKGMFDRFKQKNTAMVGGAKLLPDSIYANYRPTR